MSPHLFAGELRKKQKQLWLIVDCAAARLGAWQELAWRLLQTQEVRAWVAFSPAVLPFFCWVRLPENKECEQNNVFFRRNRKSLVSGNTYYISTRNLWYSCGQIYMCTHSPVSGKGRRQITQIKCKYLNQLWSKCVRAKRNQFRNSITQNTRSHAHTHIHTLS